MFEAGTRKERYRVGLKKRVYDVTVMDEESSLLEYMRDLWRHILRSFSTPLLNFVGSDLQVQEIFHIVWSEDILTPG